MVYFSYFVYACLATLVSSASLFGGPKVTLANKDVITGNSGLLVESFMGIPYAQPPVGPLRFKRAQPFTGSLNGYKATSWGKACIPMNALSDYDESTLLSVVGTVGWNFISKLPIYEPLLPPSDENCLFLNIWRPAGAGPNSKLPVMLWSFGGGFQVGASNLYDGSVVVTDSISFNQKVIYVNYNYRNGVYGWLAGSDIKNEGGGNAGLTDALQALKWIADNIAAFGGDPDNVTIFGESAGSIISGHLMIAFNGDNTYKGKPLFHGAIMQSGSVLPTLPIDSEYPQDIYNRFVTKAGCGSASDKLACLRALPADQITDAQVALPGIISFSALKLAFMPRPDGDIITDTSFSLIANGKYAKIPYIIGDQEDEGTIFSLTNLNITTEPELEQYLNSLFYRATPEDISELLEYYPKDPSQGSPFRTGVLNQVTPEFKRIAALMGDAPFQAPRRHFLASTNTPSWSFMGRTQYGLPGVGTLHGSDVAFQYFVPLTVPSNAYRRYFIAFANHKDPNVGSGLIHWPQYDALHSKNILNIDLLALGIGADTSRLNTTDYYATNVQKYSV